LEKGCQQSLNYAVDLKEGISTKPTLKKVKNKMMNDGKSIERIVKLIEGWLIPEGFKIESRKAVYDEGVQIAEFDIEISGKIGSAPFKGLIECRDRPSEGPAPASWIEQLYGRCKRFNFDKVMAVSTTGFAKGAKKEAERFNIELRNLEDVTYDTVANWLPFNAPLIIRHGEFSDTKVYLEYNHDQEHHDTLTLKMDTNQANFIHTETGEKLSLKEIWQKTLNENPQLFGRIKPNSEPKSLTIRANYSQSKKYQLLMEKKLVPISYIDFQATLRVIIPRMPISQIAQYLSQRSKSEEEEQIVQLARWEGADNDIIKELIFVGVPKKPSN
jgi:hypothetical protein